MIVMNIRNLALAALLSALLLIPPAACSSNEQSPAPARQGNPANDNSWQADQRQAAQVGKLGDTFTVNDVRQQGNPYGGVIEVTVSDFGPATEGLVETDYYTPKGTIQQVFVALDQKSGKPYYDSQVQAFTDKGTVVDDINIYVNDPGLMAGPLTAGEHKEGLVAFDVPTGQTVEKVMWIDGYGTQHAVWSVK